MRVCAHISCCNLLYMFETRCAYRMSYGTRRVAETFFWRQSSDVSCSWHLFSLGISCFWPLFPEMPFSSHLISSHVFPPHLISSRLISPDVFSSRLVSSLLSSVSYHLSFSQLMSSHVCSPFLILSPQLFSQFCRGVFLFPEPLQQLRFSTSEGKSRVSSTRSARRFNSAQLVSTQLFTALLKSSQLISSLFISSHLLIY